MTGRRDGEDASGSCAQVVREIYAALAARDAALVETLVEAHADPDVVLHRPESLPGGGPTRTSRRLARFFRAVAESDGPIDVSAMHVGALVACGDTESDVVVRLDFPVDGEPSTAVEWWRFRDGRVVSVHAYYWDTAAMLGGSGT